MMAAYLLAPLESRIRDQAVFSVLTQTINPVFGSAETVVHGWITYIDGKWFAGREVALSQHLPEMGYQHPDDAARAVIA